MKIVKNLIRIHLIVYYVVFLGYIIDEKVEAGTLDVRSLDYNGTWDDFCDDSKIDADYINYTDHDLKRLRILLCQLKSRDQINRETLPAFGAYKYCLVVRPTIEVFYKGLKDKIAKHFEQQVGETPTSARPTDECFTKVSKVFHRECMGTQNPCIRMFQSLISSTCVRPGITAQDISRFLTEVCDGNYLSDGAEWGPIHESLIYTD